ncbi:hypothetical protein [Psychrobacillus sp. FSL H8-0487]
MRKLNNYFFDTESINLSDGLWFYGTYIVTIAITLGIFISIL